MPRVYGLFCECIHRVWIMSLANHLLGGLGVGVHV